MKVAYLLPALIIVSTLAFAFKNSRFGVPSPAYRVVANDGPFEVRDYPEMVVVATPLEVRDSAEESSFMRLFRYISGANEAQQKIAMTSPVVTSDDSGEWRMSFIVPEDVVKGGAPQPSAANVALETIPAGRFAVYRFSGRWTTEKFEASADELRAWLDEHGLQPSGNPIVANYDPPFVPPAMRRNEVWFRLES